MSASLSQRKKKEMAQAVVRFKVVQKDALTLCERSNHCKCAEAAYHTHGQSGASLLATF